MIRALLAVFLLAAVPALTAAEPLPPSPKPNYVLDRAGWLGTAEFLALDSKLEAFERETSSQIVVAIFPEIPAGEEMFDFSQRLFDKWKPGGEKEDNGALFLIFAADRKMRIHTGYGMEGVLPDARAKQIISDRVAPLLRAGDRAGAIHAGVDAMISAAKGEYKGDGSTRLDGRKNQDIGPGWFFFLFLAIAIFGPMLRRLLGGDRVYSDRGIGPAPWIGGGFGGGGGGFGSGGGGFSGGGGSSGGGGASGSW